MNQLFMLVRADGSPASLLPYARQAVSALDPEQPVYLIQTLTKRSPRHRSSSASPRCW